jgi:hypothetical protein
MNSSFLSIVLSSAAVSTTLTGLLVWIFKSWISQRLARISEDRTRKLEKLLAYYERQIEEYYGPLWNMIHQLYVCNEIKDDLLKNLDPQRKHAVEEYYQATYFRPLHEDIRQIIKTKLYLTDGADMPNSFYKYLRHSIQERDQRELSRNRGVDTSAKGVAWPQEFENDIKKGFSKAMRRREACLNGLGVN